MRAACVQLRLAPAERPAERRARVDALLRGLGGADLVVLPELWAVGYFSFDRYQAEAEPLDGPTVQLLAAHARRLGAWVHTGSFLERGEDGALHNTALLLDPQGDVALRYRKVHLFGHGSAEPALLVPGAEAPVCPTDLGVVATATCYDLRFPELFRLLAARGAEVFCVPAAWPAERRAHWRLLCQARALENLAWVVGCNGAGDGGGVRLGGGSLVVDPWGEVVGEAPEDEEAVLQVELEPERVAKVRAEFPVLGDRRLEVRFGGS